EEVHGLDAAGGHDAGRALEREADESDLGPAEAPGLVSREDRLAVALLDDVRSEVLERSAVIAVAVLAAVDRVAATVLDPEQLVDALVELVVADRRDIEPDGVHRLDRRLIVECCRDQRRAADEVTSSDLERALGVRSMQGLDVGREELHPARGCGADDATGTGRRLEV